MYRFTARLRVGSHYTRCVQERLGKKHEEPAQLVFAQFQISSATFRNAFAIHSFARGNFYLQILVTWCQRCVVSLNV